MSVHVLHPSKHSKPSTCQNLDKAQSRSQSQHQILVFTCLRGHRPSLSPQPSSSKAEAAPPRHPSPHTPRADAVGLARWLGPGVSSFTVTSHHRPLTRGIRLPRILENARPSGERNKRGFASSLRNMSDERLESGCRRMTALRGGYWLVKGDGLGGDRAIGTGRACL